MMLDPHKEYFATELLVALENEAAWHAEWIAVVIGTSNLDDRLGENEVHKEEVYGARQLKGIYGWEGKAHINIPRMSTPPPIPSLNQLGQKQGPAINSPEQKSNPRDLGVDVSQPLPPFKTNNPILQEFLEKKQPLDLIFSKFKVSERQINTSRQQLKGGSTFSFEWKGKVLIGHHNKTYAIILPDGESRKFSRSCCRVAKITVRADTMFRWYRLDLSFYSHPDPKLTQQKLTVSYKQIGSPSTILILGLPVILSGRQQSCIEETIAFQRGAQDEDAMFRLLSSFFNLVKEVTGTAVIFSWMTGHQTEGINLVLEDFNSPGGGALDHYWRTLLLDYVDPPFQLAEDNT
ncbi:hypothetical protein BT69DRAFT_1292544 [Atractiella rhizophila]|nr:hypothetical protein BT69DRAFT_1292544 [Atractiella rhizophila]